jgi:hypothetical protein
MQRKYLIGLSVLILIVIAGGAYYVYQQKEAASENAALVRNIVYNFGDQLKGVTPLIKHEDFVAQMNAHYAKFVHQDLMNKWNAQPETAPGRVSISPWPEMIEIDSKTLNKNGSYTVEAHIVQKTKGADGGSVDAGSVPIRLIVTMGPDGWQITDYEVVR